MRGAERTEGTMTYHISRTVKAGFDETVARVKAELAKEGFGVLTEIDVRATLKAKLGVEFRNYRILGACNPQLAYGALEAEDRIGVMLPCNVVVQEHAPGEVEVSAINPVAAMERIGNQGLTETAGQVTGKLMKVVESV